MGFFDDDLFGGLFDFDGDGKTSFSEGYLGFKMFEDSFKEQDDDDFEDDWRLFCEDGSEYGIFPDEYETREEYEQALEDAKFGL